MMFMSVVSVFIIPCGLTHRSPCSVLPLVFLFAFSFSFYTRFVCVCVCVCVCVWCLPSFTDDERRDVVSLQSGPLICLPLLASAFILTTRTQMRRHTRTSTRTHRRTDAPEMSFFNCYLCFTPTLLSLLVCLSQACWPFYFSFFPSFLSFSWSALPHTTFPSFVHHPSLHISLLLTLSVHTS